MIDYRNLPVGTPQDKRQLAIETWAKRRMDMHDIRSLSFDRLPECRVSTKSLPQLLPFGAIPIRFYISHFIFLLQRAATVTIDYRSDPAFYHRIGHDHTYLHHFEPLPAITTQTV